MIKEFFNTHIWPFSAIHKRDLLFAKLDEALRKADATILTLRLDICEITRFCAENLISFNAIQTEDNKPIRIAYATGLAKATVEPGLDSHGAFAHISYIVSEPIAYHINESLRTLKLKGKFSQRCLKTDLRNVIANRLIDQSSALVENMIFDEDIPE